MLGKLGKLATALLFYLPFLFTLMFCCLAFLLGIAVILSGSFVFLLFAVYGMYAISRDFGALGWIQQKGKKLYESLHKGFLQHLKASFVLQQKQHIPIQNALYICEPHGLIGYSWIYHFCYKLSEWPEGSPRPFLAAHSILFTIPLIREVLESFHFIDSSEEKIKEYLKQGKSVALLVGGIEEMVYNGQQPIQLILKKRKGYARIAREVGVPIVPLFAKGENELFPPPTFWMWKVFSSSLYKILGLQIPMPSWISMKRWASLVDKPFDTPIETYVLEKIETRGKSDTTIRKETLQRFREFFQDKEIQATFKG